MNPNFPRERYFFAIEPDSGIIAAKWPVEVQKSVEDLELQKQAYQAMVGDDWVVLDSRSRPEWNDSLANVSEGREPGSKHQNSIFSFILHYLGYIPIGMTLFAGMLGFRSRQ